MPYRCEAQTPEGFIQQLAVSYIANGYWFYVSGLVPETKDPKAVDEKLIRKYGIDISKFARARRKRAGIANLQYLRFERFFVLIATHGRHRFFEEEGTAIRDVRQTPVKFASYAVSYRGAHAHVRIEQQTFRDLKAYFEERAVRKSAEELEDELWSLGFEPYAPVRRQLLSLLRTITSKRHTAGLEQLDYRCLQLRRQTHRPFARAA